MADYNKLTVANLKTILKERSIPSTGLTRKQQIIDKLLEHDAQSRPAIEEPADEGPVNSAPVGTQPEEEHVASTGRSQETSAQGKPSDRGTRSNDRTGTSPASEASSTKGSPPVPAQTERPPEPIKHHASLEPVEGEPQNLVSQTQASQSQTETTQPPSSTPLRDAASPVAEGTSGDESRKRKRRSLTPPVDAEAVAVKKRKQEQKEGAVHLKEDVDADVPVRSEHEIKDIAMSEAVETADDKTLLVRTPDDAIELAKATTEDQAAGHAKDQQEKSKEIASKHDQNEEANRSAVDQVAPADQESTTPNRDEGKPDPPNEGILRPLPHDKSQKTSHWGKDNRYKDLINSTSEAQPHEPDARQNEDEVPETTPALHPATSALYIRELKRPLRPEDLRAHLISLSRPPTAESPREELIIDRFHLDSIRSHCFVKFSGVTEASRVRSALHNRVWPAGRDRNPLWVDFVPEEDIEDWIRTEESSAGEGGRLGGKRWEVIYQDGDDGGIKAVFQEVGPGGSAAPRSAPLGPRGSFAEARKASIHTTPIQGQEKQSKAFQSLDELFRSTTAKPKLYYLPVSRDIADKRLDELDRLTSRNAPKYGDRFEEYRRFTYEDEDLLVDAGPDYGPRRGGSGRGRGGGYRGGYRDGSRYDDTGYRGDRYRNDEPSRGGFGFDRRGGYRGR